jgi:hypothetical protein
MIYSYAEGGGIREVEGNRKDMSSWVNKVSLYRPSSPPPPCLWGNTTSASFCDRLCLLSPVFIHSYGGGGGGAVFIPFYIYFHITWSMQLGCKHYGWMAVIRRALWTCKAHGSSPPRCIVTKCDKKAAVEESILIWIQHHISRKSTEIPFLISP